MLPISNQPTDLPAEFKGVGLVPVLASRSTPTSRARARPAAAGIYMLEPKASNQMEDPVVLAKRDAAVKWCANASAYSAQTGGKPWKYALMPHTAIAQNMTLEGLVLQFGGGLDGNRFSAGAVA